jgi:hypothetical protein
VEVEAEKILAVVIIYGVSALMPAVLPAIPIIAMVSAVLHRGQDAIEQTSADNKCPKILITPQKARAPYLVLHRK